MEPERQPAQSRWPQWLFPTALLLVSWLWVAALVMQTRPGDDVVAVIFPPWWTADRSFAAVASAGAAIVRAGGISTILVVQPGGPDGLERLRGAGAWFAIDPKAVDACFETGRPAPHGGRDGQ
jgi:hypothetical protein